MPIVLYFMYLLCKANVLLESPSFPTIMFRKCYLPRQQEDNGNLAFFFLVFGIFHFYGSALTVRFYKQVVVLDADMLYFMYFLYNANVF